MAHVPLNADFGRLIVVHTGEMDWQASPSPSVRRKRLDLAGDAEKSRVTSVVRYDADSAFPSHPHPDGEKSWCSTACSPTSTATIRRGRTS